MWDADAVAGAGAAVVEGEEEVEDEDDVGDDCAEFAEWMTLAAAPAAPIKACKGSTVVLAAAIFTGRQVDEEEKEVALNLMWERVALIKAAVMSNQYKSGSN